MPCILKERTSPMQTILGHCGKMLDLNKKYFKNSNDALQGNLPICIKCRKTLNLDKKIIKKNITSISIDSNYIHIFYNDKTKTKLDYIFSNSDGFLIENYTNIETEFISEIKTFLKYKSLEKCKNIIKRISFDSIDINVIKKLKENASLKNDLNLSDIEIIHINSIIEKLEIFLLKDKK